MKLRQNFRYFTVLASLPLLMAWQNRLEPEAVKSVSFRSDWDLPLTEKKFLTIRPHTFGFENWSAGLLWIHLLQVASHEPVAPDKLAWEYPRVLSIIQLDPRFDAAYRFGAAFLSVFRQDHLGAEDVLRRWCRRRPRAWYPHLALGFHLYADRGNSSEAGDVIFKASQMEGAPPWLSSLGIRLLSETTAYQHSLAQAIQLYKSVVSTEARSRLANRIRSLRYQIEKKYWQDQLAEFQKGKGRPPRDFEELAREFAHQKDRDLAASTSATELEPADLTQLLAERFEFRYDSHAKRILIKNPEQESVLETVGRHRPRHE